MMHQNVFFSFLGNFKVHTIKSSSTWFNKKNHEYKLSFYSAKLKANVEYFQVKYSYFLDKILQQKLGTSFYQ